MLIDVPSLIFVGTATITDRVQAKMQCQTTLKQFTLYVQVRLHRIPGDDRLQNSL